MKLSLFDYLPEDLTGLTRSLPYIPSHADLTFHFYMLLTVDFYNSDIFITPTTLADDGNHPNAAGYDLITQAWYKALITILP